MASSAREGILIILPTAMYANTTVENDLESIRKTHVTIDNEFKTYLEKFAATKVWEKIDKKNKLLGKNKTVADEYDAMLNGIDEIDELLNLKVTNGNPRIEIQRDGRRWHPSKGNRGSYYNRYQLKERIMELIKQAIYQARYKMIIMQTLRKKYNRNAVYKMGFLMSKTDLTCKTFASLANKLQWDCSNKRQQVTRWYWLIDSLSGSERLLDLWFEVDLLIDLITKNDENCRRMLKEVMANRKRAWKFYD